jgi:glycosyltransferase involved in cell wall biosynthesis
LIFVGDGEERAELERLVVDQAVESDVVFLGARSDIHQLLTVGDAFLLSSISEGIPLSLIEAMGAGISS